METVRLALQAMATRFELVLYGDDRIQLRAAGEEALREIQQLEEELSFYRPSSEISRLNKHAAKKPVRTSPRVFRLLQQSAHLHAITHGAFDITVAPLMRSWGFTRGNGQWPDKKVLQQARSKTGMHLVELEEKDGTVHFQKEGVLLDLGAIGKGFAIEEATAILQECGITSAFLHGGTSTMVAIGTPPDHDTWKVAVAHPTIEDIPLAIISLCNQALSVSAPSGKAFVHDGLLYGHVLDPRTGYPVRGASIAAVVHASATTCDALSTALLVLGEKEVELLEQTEHTTGVMVACIDKGNNTLRIHGQGIDVHPESHFSS